MKLQYLAQVQKLLEEYDFQDKYKIMLELEDEISRLERNGIEDGEALLAELGSPADFVSTIVGTFDLTKIQNHHQKNDKIDDIEELLSITKTDLDQQICKADLDNTININQLKTTNQSKNNQIQPTDTQAEHASEQKMDIKKQNEQKKKPVKILFSIILTLLFIFSFFTVAITLVIAIGLFFVIGIQPALSLFLGILFLLLTIVLIINLIKNIIYNLITHETKLFKLIISFIFILVFAYLSKIMISSSLGTIGLYITDNLNLIQPVLLSYNVDISNINWQSLSFGEYVKLFFNIIKSLMN